MPLLAIFTASYAAVFLQVSLMRLMSVTFQPMLVFAMIGVALLGYGAAGSLLAAFGSPRAADTTRYFAWRLLACACIALPVWVLVNAIDVPSQTLFETPAGWAIVVVFYTALSLPFLCIGLGMPAAFTAFPDDINRLYFADLIGAGAGGLSAVASVPWLGGPALVPAAGVIAAAMRRDSALARSALETYAPGIPMAEHGLWEHSGELIAYLTFAGVMIGLAFWGRRAPMRAIGTAAALWMGLVAADAVVEPATIRQGLMLKAVLLGWLILGVGDALSIRRRIRTLRS